MLDDSYPVVMDQVIKRRFTNKCIQNNKAGQDLFYYMWRWGTFNKLFRELTKLDLIVIRGFVYYLWGTIGNPTYAIFLELRVNRPEYPS